MQSLNYYLSEYPSIVNFRWSHTQTLGSTWSFLFSSIAIYVLAAATSTPSSLSSSPNVVASRSAPIPALHSLCLFSAVIFVGILLSSAADIRDTPLVLAPYQNHQHPIPMVPSASHSELALRVACSSGPTFYLSRFLHFFRTFITILRRRKLTFFHLFNQSILLLTSFLWLQFSQSFQVSAILLATVLYSVVYGYRFWTAIGLPSSGCFSFVLNCQVVLLGCSLAGHLGVIFLHFVKGGCNGMGAWCFNSVLNAVILCLFLDFYFKSHLRRRTVGDVSRLGGGSSSARYRRARRPN
ncbi:hypothetical protein V6N11_066709 [Hibiscus sabdariffa]|uniref:Elongation of fatty acids protein 3-like n=1 Tax=Hibiscus sabdariffa TaxID=183260 RepID=A0ABR1ZM65_9ROSI